MKICILLRKFEHQDIADILIKLELNTNQSEVWSCYFWMSYWPCWLVSSKSMYMQILSSTLIMINNINCKNIHVSTLFSSFNIIIYILYLTGMGRPSVFWCYWQSDRVWRQSDENDFGKWFDDPRCFNDHIWCLVSQSFYYVLEKKIRLKQVRPDTKSCVKHYVPNKII